MYLVTNDTYQSIFVLNSEVTYQLMSKARFIFYHVNTVWNPRSSAAIYFIVALLSIEANLRYYKLPDMF